VSKFHSIWCLVAQESRLGRKIQIFGKFLGGPDISGTSTRHIRFKAGRIRHFCRTYPEKPDMSGSRPDISNSRPDMSAGQFQQQRSMTVLGVIC
jgi:hypothetical protein